MNATKQHKWIGLVLFIIVLAAGLVVWAFPGRTDAAAAPANTATVVRGDLTESATASGQIEAGRAATLSLETAGVVAEAPVAGGDGVAAGDLLVRLETDALERAVASAKAGLISAQAQLENLLAGPDEATLAAAEAAVASAQARLDDLADGPSPAEIAASTASVAAARDNVAAAAARLDAATDAVSQADILAAQADLDAALKRQTTAHDLWVRLADCTTDAAGAVSCVPSGLPGMDAATQQVALANAQVAVARARLEELQAPGTDDVASAQAALASASAQLDAAEARHEDLLAGATEAELAAAAADLARAGANLARLQAGPTAAEQTRAEIQVAQAETSLRQAENALADASLVAPFDGLVIAANAVVGERASGPVVTLVDTSSLEVVLNVDEIDVGALAPGQAATVTLEAWPDTAIPAEITTIAPDATRSASGIVTYAVHLSLGETDLPVLVGMTANADLLLAQREGVLLVPNAAITADRAAGTYTVNRLVTDATGQPAVETVAVTIGLRDGDHTEITSGLNAGDAVVLGQLSAPTRTFDFGRN